MADIAVVGNDPLLEVPMAHRGRALAIAVDAGLGNAAAYDHLAPEQQPHLRLRGIDERLSGAEGSDPPTDLTLESGHQRNAGCWSYGVQ